MKIVTRIFEAKGREDTVEGRRRSRCRPGFPKLSQQITHHDPHLTGGHGLVVMTAGSQPANPGSTPGVAPYFDSELRSLITPQLAILCKLKAIFATIIDIEPIKFRIPAKVTLILERKLKRYPFGNPSIQTS